MLRAEESDSVLKHSRLLAVPALRLALRLKNERELAFLWSASGAGRSFIGVRPLARSDALDPEPELATSERPSLLESAPRWIGVVPYEARRSLERPGLGRDGDDREEPHVMRSAWWRFGADANIAVGVGKADFWPSAGTNNSAHAPALCQPRTVSDLGSGAPV